MYYAHAARCSRRVSAVAQCRRSISFGAALAVAVALAAISISSEARASKTDADEAADMDQLGLFQVSAEMTTELMIPKRSPGLSEKVPTRAPGRSPGLYQQWDDFLSNSYEGFGQEHFARAMAIPSHPVDACNRSSVEALNQVGVASAGGPTLHSTPVDQAFVDMVVMSILAGLLGLFIIWSAFDFYTMYKLAYTSEADKEAAKKPWESDRDEMGDASGTGTDTTTARGNQASRAPREEVKESWSILALLGLTFYRFYTGFLSATWLPYLLAMEGAELWADNQALFMAVAKLIYGLSILFTPLLGILGDRLAESSLGVGRRLFIRAGVIVSAGGIFLCHWASPHGQFTAFLIGILIWRLGEGLNDVTTEAICPELLPKSQFQLSGSIKASIFLVGGVFGYIMLANVSDWHYSWLYQGYLILMFTNCIPPLLLIRDDAPRLSSRRAAGGTSGRLSEFRLSTIKDAYIRPGMYKGGFPRATLCVFIFSLGAAPPFFLLLMLRDLVGIDEYGMLQRQFSYISIVFFLSAAVAAAVLAVMAPRMTEADDDEAEDERLAEQTSRLWWTGISIMFFGCICFCMPFMHFGNTRYSRMVLFYILAGLLGLTFGATYARFQDCQWSLLPKGVETANAMGFSTTWKLVGTGAGNFCAGIILDLFADRNQHMASSDGRTTQLVAYHTAGYFTVCTLSAVLCWGCGYLVTTIPRQVYEARKLKNLDATAPMTSF